MIRRQTDRVRYQNDPRRLRGAGERYNLDFPPGGSRRGDKNAMEHHHHLLLPSDCHSHGKLKQLRFQDEPHSEEAFFPYGTAKPSSLWTQRLPRDPICVESSIHQDSVNNAERVTMDNSTVGPTNGCREGVDQFVHLGGQILESASHALQEQMQQLVVVARNETTKLTTTGESRCTSRVFSLNFDRFELVLQESAGHVLDSITTNIAMMDRPRFMAEDRGGVNPEVCPHGENETSVKIHGSIEMKKHSILPSTDASGSSIDESSLMLDHIIPHTIMSTDEESKENDIGVRFSTIEPAKADRICISQHLTMNNGGYYSSGFDMTGDRSDWMTNATMDCQAGNRHTRTSRQKCGLDDKITTSGETLLSSSVSKEQPKLHQSKPGDSFVPIVSQDQDDHFTVQCQFPTTRKANDCISKEDRPYDEKEISDRANDFYVVQAPPREALQIAVALPANNKIDDRIAHPNDAFGETDEWFNMNLFDLNPNGEIDPPSDTSLRGDDRSLDRENSSSNFLFPASTCFDASNGDTSTSTDVVDNTSRQHFSRPVIDVGHPKHSVAAKKNPEAPQISRQPHARKLEHLEQGRVQDTIQVSAVPLSREEGVAFPSWYVNKLDDTMNEGKKCRFSINPVTTWKKSRKMVTRGDYLELEETQDPFHCLAEF